jgi:hypothetical protein
MADHLTKALQPTLFHHHADFLLGHIPPSYSPVYKSTVGNFPNCTPNIDLFVIVCVQKVTKNHCQGWHLLLMYLMD